MSDILDEVKKNISVGYHIEELKPEDMTRLKQAAEVAEQALAAIDDFSEDYDTTPIYRRDDGEVIEIVRSRVFSAMVFNLCELVYAIMDGDEYYYEEDSIQ